jgi:hypothetical protein
MSWVTYVCYHGIPVVHRAWRDHGVSGAVPWPEQAFGPSHLDVSFQMMRVQGTRDALCANAALWGHEITNHQHHVCLGAVTRLLSRQAAHCRVVVESGKDCLCKDERAHRFVSCRANHRGTGVPSCERAVVHELRSKQVVPARMAH